MQLKALEGIRVLDLTQAYSGPFATMQLADHGAEVIKIERPGIGDQTRIWMPYANGKSVYYTFVNRNKKSLTLNLKSEEAKKVFFKLAETADVIVENFKPGQVNKMGIGYDQIHKLNPRIIYASLSGYGQTGPLKDRTAYASIAEAFSGLMSITGFPDTPPTITGGSFGDSFAGSFLALGICMALFHRERSGDGQYLEIAMTDTMLHCLESAVVSTSVNGGSPERNGNRDAAGAPYDSYRTKDGWCVFGVGSEDAWVVLCHAMGMDELVTDPRFEHNGARKLNEEELTGIIESWTKTKTRAELEPIMYEYGIPYSPVLTIDEAMGHPQFKERNMIIEQDIPVAGKIKIQGVPIKFSATPGGIEFRAPETGEHNEEMLVSIGFSQEEIHRLKKQGVI